jgi:hypothetical protein
MLLQALLGYVPGLSEPARKSVDSNIDPMMRAAQIMPA